MRETKRPDRYAISLILTTVCLFGIAGCGSSNPPADDPVGEETVEEKNPQLAVLTESWDAQAEVPWETASLLGKLSKAAYLEEQEANTEFQQIGFAKSTAHVSGSMVAYVVQSGTLTVVVFRGTDDLDDWLVNLKASSTKVSGGNMHSGFHEAYQTLRSDVHAAIDQLRPEHLWITGHSLGGALAVVCAHDLLQENHDIHGLMTFGQPMATEADLAAYLDEQLTNKYERFINGADIVPRVPPHFTHFGSFVWFQQEGVTRSQKLARQEASDTRTLKAPPLGPPPLEDKEFKELQEKLRQSKPQSSNKTALKAKFAFPPIDDHGMDRYLRLIDRRGEASSSDQPGPTQLPTQPPELPKGLPSKRPGPPRLP